MTEETQEDQEIELTPEELDETITVLKKVISEQNKAIGQLITDLAILAHKLGRYEEARSRFYDDKESENEAE